MVKQALRSSVALWLLELYLYGWYSFMLASLWIVLGSFIAIL